MGESVCIETARRDLTAKVLMVLVEPGRVSGLIVLTPLCTSK